MLDLHYIISHREDVVARLQAKKVQNAEALIEKVISINQERRRTQTELDHKLSLVNQLSKKIEQHIALVHSSSQQIEALKSQSKALKAEIKGLEANFATYENSLKNLLAELPNLPHSTVPIGAHSADNKVVYQVENLRSPYQAPLPHWELIRKYDIIDFELGNKLTGAGFPVYKGKGAKLQRALINFFLDEAEKAGYVEVQPPVVVNRDSVYATGQLPDKEGQMYELVNESLYLISTAEIPITNLYRGDLLEGDVLPIRHVGYTPCFRREAGSWGSHVRGLNRLHQFDKVEIVEIVLPQDSYHRLEVMRRYVEGLVQKLGLPYRVLALCTGDLGFCSAFTYDIEVFSVGQERWLEVSSISNFESYQANRLQLRYKEEGKIEYLHTLNGSAIALPRIMAALLEYNFVGHRVNIPAILQPYTGFTYID